MTWESWALAGPALLALVLLVALARLRSRTSRELAAARAEAAELRERLDRLEEARTEPAPDPPIRTTQEFTITRVGDAPGRTGDDQTPTHLEPAVFTDILLRESVIRLGSLAYGVRRALAPETRNRIRFEMRREVKRSRKDRRAEQREAWREWQARQRDRVPDDRLRDTA